MGKDDWDLCEGLLQVFINADASKQQVMYKRAQSVNQPASVDESSDQQKVLLDFGSCKQTVSISNPAYSAAYRTGSSSPGSIQFNQSSGGEAAGGSRNATDFDQFVPISRKAS